MTTHPRSLTEPEKTERIVAKAQRWLSPDRQHIRYQDAVAGYRDIAVANEHGNRCWYRAHVACWIELAIRAIPGSHAAISYVIATATASLARTEHEAQRLAAAACRQLVDADHADMTAARKAAADK